MLIGAYLAQENDHFLCPFNAVLTDRSLLITNSNIMSKEQDLNNYMNAEYWRLRYFRSKANLLTIIVWLALILFGITGAMLVAISKTLDKYPSQGQIQQPQQSIIFNTSPPEKLHNTFPSFPGLPSSPIFRF